MLLGKPLEPLGNVALGSKGCTRDKVAAAIGIGSGRPFVRLLTKGEGLLLSGSEAHPEKPCSAGILSIMVRPGHPEFSRLTPIIPHQSSHQMSHQPPHISRQP